MRGGRKNQEKRESEREAPKNARSVASSAAISKCKSSNVLSHVGAVTVAWRQVFQHHREDVVCDSKPLIELLTGAQSSSYFIRCFTAAEHTVIE